MNTRWTVGLLTTVALLAGCSKVGPLPQNDTSRTAWRSLTHDDRSSEASSENEREPGDPVATEEGAPSDERALYRVRWQDDPAAASAAGGAPNGDSSESRCDWDAPGRSYIGRSAAECSRINFLCVEATTMFADDCGCGCAAE